MTRARGSWQIHDWSTESRVVKHLLVNIHIYMLCLSTYKRYEKKLFASFHINFCRQKFFIDVDWKTNLLPRTNTKIYILRFYEQLIKNKNRYRVKNFDEFLILRSFKLFWGRFCSVQLFLFDKFNVQ